MIIEFLMQLASGFGSWALGLLPPTRNAADLIVGAADVFTPILAGGAALGSWLPWGTLAAVFPVVMGFYVGAFLVKVARQLIAHAPFIGGTG